LNIGFLLNTSHVCISGTRGKTFWVKQKYAGRIE
jgi:hypothetical protein